MAKNGPQDTSTEVGTEVGPLRPARGPGLISWLIPQLVPAVVVLGSQVQAFPPPPPPPQAPPPNAAQRSPERQPSPASQPSAAGQVSEGTRLWINGQTQAARWRWIGRGRSVPQHTHPKQQPSQHAATVGSDLLCRPVCQLPLRYTVQERCSGGRGQDGVQCHGAQLQANPGRRSH